MIIYVDDLTQKGPDIYANLTERELRFSYEKAGGFFIAESPNVITRALDAGYEPISFLMEERHIHNDASQIIQRCPSVPVYTSSRQILEKLTGYKLTRGVLAAFKRKTQQDFRKICQDARRIAILEDIADTSNLGAIFRSAAALGIDAILLSPKCADPLNRRCLRVSMGNVFKINWAFVSKNAEDWPDKGMDELKEIGFKTLSMALRHNSIEITDQILKKEEKLAILLGTEGTGLLEKTIEKSDYVAKIPMKDGIDSLNVAAAAAIIFWEVGTKYIQQ